MRLLKKSTGLAVLSIAALALVGCGQSNLRHAKAIHSQKHYPVCNVNALAASLKQSGQAFSVRKVEDDTAGYTYYMIALEGAFNADKARGAVCRYVNQNQCHLFWGNVAHLAMISSQKAPWFPGDTTPHYTLSPIITCNNLTR